MKYLNLKKILKGFSILMLPVFLLAVQADVASAKSVRGSSKIGKKRETCQAKIYTRRGRKRIKGRCVGAINSRFSGLYSGAVLVKHKGKYKITTRMVNRRSSGFTLKITAFNKRNRKTFRGSIPMR